MRVISGKAKGKTLLSVPGDTTRPVLDRVKTALFDMLRPVIEGARVYDMFAGSGALGIEALSQGASHAVFVDIEPAAAKTIRTNLETTGLSDLAEVRQSDTFLYLEKSDRVFDLIFVAPPQYKNLWMEALRRLADRPERLAPDGIVIAQIDPREYEPLALSGLTEYHQRKYGNTSLIFYKRT